MSIPFVESDVAVVGGGLGGVAAALAAAEAGLRVVLSESTDWIGGQVTAQAVSALDEHPHIETFGGTRAYYRFREGVREYYRKKYPAVARAGTWLNPGSAWGAALSFEPRAGLRVLEDMLAEHIAAGRLRVLLEHSPISASLRGGSIREVTLAGPEETRVTVRADFFLDATELGDLLPLVGAPYVYGAEAAADTGEPHGAPDGPHPERVQSFAHCFLVQYRPGEDHTIRKPNGYDYYRQSQPFSLVLPGREGGFRRFSMFEGEQSFWSAARVFDASMLTPGAFVDAGVDPDREAGDIALIRWESMDFAKESLIDRSAAQKTRVLREARRLSLSFLYWLQTEAPRDDAGTGQLGGRGYPGLRLLPEAVGTADGLAKVPHTRESRRVLGFRRVLEQDITAQPGRGARAAHYADTVGVGWHALDLHRRAGEKKDGRELLDLGPSLPFQIPLGALLCPAVDNLIAASKNISTTHITNAAYRVHPVEWAVGEAAGSLAAFCLLQSTRPRAVWEQPENLRAFQQTLLRWGVPLSWAVDAGLDDPDFAALQSCLLNGPPPEGSPRRERLELLPDDLLSRREGAWLIGLFSRAAENSALADLLARWNDASPGPLTDKDWSAACAALDLPAREGSGYPTLREVSQKLAFFA